MVIRHTEIQDIMARSNIKLKKSELLNSISLDKNVNNVNQPKKRIPMKKS